MLGALQAMFGEEFSLDGIPFAGRTDSQIIRDAMISIGVPQVEIDERQQAVLAALPDYMQTEVDRGNVVVLPGVLPLLEALCNRKDVALGLVTGNTQATAPIKLAAARIDPATFPFGAFGDEASNRNALPPIALRRAADWFGETVSPNDAVIVGDTPADIECAHVNGMRAVAVATGWLSQGELAAYQPDFLFPSLINLECVISTLLSG